jgi:hypothetical protein
MNIKVDPYALTFAVIMHFFIVPWLKKHARKPRPDLPASIKLAANVLLITGSVFMVVGVICGIIFTDLSQIWRFAWIVIASVGGAIWIWNAFQLRDGICSARWISIPFLLLAVPCLPLLGWIGSPIAAYCLFLDKTAKQFFRESESYSAQK